MYSAYKRSHYFLKNDAVHIFTVNGDRYKAIITDFIVLQLNSHDVQKLLFQQDGATCYTACETFGNRIVSRSGPLNWPPRSCDLAALDYFLWVYVRSQLVYADKPETI